MDESERNRLTSTDVRDIQSDDVITGSEEEHPSTEAGVSTGNWHLVDNILC